MKAPDRGWPEPADYYVRKGEKKIVGRPAFGSIKYFMEPPPSLGASYVTNGKVYSLLYFRCCLYFNYGLVLGKPPLAALSVTILFLPEREKIERRERL